MREAAEMSESSTPTPWLRAIERIDAGGKFDPLRIAELDRFLDLGFPTQRDENWKYTRTDRLAAFADDWLDAGMAPGLDLAARQSAFDAAMPYRGDALAFVFLDGFLIPDEKPTALPDGVTINTTLLPSESLAGGSGTAIRALNAALATAVLNIDIADDCASEVRLSFVHITTASGPTLACPRLNVRAGKGSTVEISESFPASADSRVMTNAVLALDVAEGARVCHYRQQDLGGRALQVTEVSATVSSDGAFSSFSLDTGGELVRNDMNVRLAGPGAHANLNGIYLTNDSQHIDNHIFIEHISPHTSSRQEYSGIADGRSQVVFNGKVLVHKGADGTDAKQSNRNLLLSDGAEVDTKPELEIYADDVKCAHGATVGQLDENALFYLVSRGIRPETARALLIKAFVLSITAAISEARFRERFENTIAERLVAVGAS